MVQAHGTGVAVPPAHAYPAGHATPAVEVDAAGQYAPATAAHRLQYFASSAPPTLPAVPTGQGSGAEPA